MKNIISFTILFLITSSVFAGEFYAGGSSGYSNLNYDVNGEAWKYIATNKTASQINAIVQTLDGSTDINSNKGSPFSKMFIGYNLNRYWGVEAFYMTIDGYSASGSATASVNPTYRAGQSHNNISLSAYGRVDATATASADFSGYGLRLNGYIPVSKQFYIMAALGGMNATTNIKTSYNVDVDWSYNGEVNAGPYGASTGDAGTYNANDSDAYSITGIVPVISLGVVYKMTKNFNIRAEAELYGIPIDGSSISVLSGGVQYTF